MTEVFHRRGKVPQLKGKLNRSDSIVRIPSPSYLKRAEGRSSGPKWKDDFIFENSGLISLEWNEDLRGDAEETKRISGKMLSPIVK